MKKACAHCKEIFNEEVSASSNNTSPKPGDILLCMACYKLNLYDENLGLVIPDQEYIESIPEWFLVEIDKQVESLKAKKAEDDNAQS